MKRSNKIDHEYDKGDFDEKPPRKKDSSNFADNDLDYKNKHSKYGNKESENTHFGEKAERGGNFKTRGGSWKLIRGCSWFRITQYKSSNWISCISWWRDSDERSRK